MTTQTTAPDVITRFVRSALVALQCDWPDTPEAQIDVLRRAHHWCQVSATQINTMMTDIEAQLDAAPNGDPPDDGRELTASEEWQRIMDLANASPALRGGGLHRALLSLDENG